uniref:ELMO/CED-12 domain containing 2 n=1 Tax=Callorhinchus milii TaxID=7868 RepID=A0A4W3JYQ5_CALMI
MIGLIWHYLYNSFLRSWLKWILRKITGTCELQRILAGSSQGAEKTMKIGITSVTVSERGMATRVCDIMGLNADFEFSFCYNTLYTDSENLRKQSFDSANVKHEDMLMKLWNILMPRIHLESRITKQWSDIGFQGDDPKTDFRGMGMLGLYNLVYFGEHYTEVARQILSHSNHPKIGYSYAIVGINLTEMAYSLLKSGALKAHFYNLVPGVPQMHHFHQFYCYLMYEFDKFWFKEEPQSIMEFNQYREQFHERVKELLKDPKAMLTLEFNK